MTAAVRLLPDLPPEREAVLLERLALSHRLRALVERAETCGADRATVAEISRTWRALGVIGELLNVTEIDGGMSCG